MPAIFIDANSSQVKLPVSQTSLELPQKSGIGNADTVSREVGHMPVSGRMDSPMSKFKKCKRYGLTLMGNLLASSYSSKENKGESGELLTPTLNKQSSNIDTIVKGLTKNKSSTNLDGYMQRVNSLKRKMTERPRQVSADIFRRIGSQQMTEHAQKSRKQLRKTSIESILDDIQ